MNINRTFFEQLAFRSENEQSQKTAIQSEEFESEVYRRIASLAEAYIRKFQGSRVYTGTSSSNGSYRVKAVRQDPTPEGKHEAFIEAVRAALLEAYDECGEEVWQRCQIDKAQDLTKAWIKEAYEDTRSVFRNEMEALKDKETCEKKRKAAQMQRALELLDEYPEHLHENTELAIREALKNPDNFTRTMHGFGYAGDPDINSSIIV